MQHGKFPRNTHLHRHRSSIHFGINARQYYLIQVE
jgi:hypothetical protein